jgi:hypothetical protein
VRVALATAAIVLAAGGGVLAWRAVEAPADPAPGPRIERVAPSCDGRTVLEVRIARPSSTPAVVRVRAYRGKAVRANLIGAAKRTVTTSRSVVRVPLMRPGRRLLEDCELCPGRRIRVVARVVGSGRPVVLRATIVGASASAPGGAGEPVATEPAEPPAPRRAEATRFEVLGRVGAPVTEASGLVQSARNPGVWWTLNDSGGAASLYAVDRSGAILATLPLAGASNRDWEDLALAPGPGGAPHLFVGDIGDNAASRASIRVYRVAEPDLAGTAAGSVLAAAPADAAVLQYEDGARDAESLVVDPASGEVWVISKREARSRAYRGGVPAFAGETSILRLHAVLPFGGAVAADACPDGETVLVKTYERIRAFSSGGGIAAALASSPSDRLYSLEPQGETVAAAPDCSGYATLSEGSDQPLVAYAE